MVQSSMGNIDAVIAHQTGLKRIVRLLGGVEALPHMTLSKLYQYAQSQGPTAKLSDN
jgi:hypothetical protein